MQTRDIIEYLKEFSLSPSHSKTKMEHLSIEGRQILKLTNEFWTSKQRQSSALHEISYRACFKGQLPGFFIKLMTEENDLVYDPFSGRGTTVVEAGLLGRKIIANDINPLSRILSEPRFAIPELEEIEARLSEIGVDKNKKAELDLSMFYHPDTEAEIVSLKNYLQAKKQRGQEDKLDRWIRMIATNRLTGHSTGFFSVYTLPPNQAVTPQSQLKINQKRNQKPEYRDTKKIILKKSQSLIRNLTQKEKENLNRAGESALFLNKDARDTGEIESESVQLTVTSPPFLNIVQYSRDNWLRCWFNSINDKEIAKKISMSKTVEDWCLNMRSVFQELFRITRSGGWVAFEVGEVRKGSISLDEYVVPLGLQAGFQCPGIITNSQEFTKTSNIWGVNNNSCGTNTNRIVLFKKVG